MYNELFDLNGSIDKKSLPIYRNGRLFIKLKTQTGFGLLYQPGFCTSEGQRCSSEFINGNR